MTTMTQRTAEHALANDLFEMETHAIETHRKLGPSATVKRIFTETLECVRTCVRVEETIAASARLRGDTREYGIAWQRVIHGTGIAQTLESCLNRWF
jgi:hypothetical protein